MWARIGYDPLCKVIICALEKHKSPRRIGFILAISGWNGKMRMRWIWLLTVCCQAFAATVVKGRLEDGTNGGPGQADRVTLVGLGQGMEILAELSPVEGDFELRYEGDLAGKPWLVQAMKGGTTYSAQGTSTDEPVVLTVYEASEEATITARGGTIAVSALGDVVDIGRFINLDNLSKPPVTLDRPDATFTFELEPGFRKVDASTTRGKMPLRQNLKIEGNRASLQYPLRPGRTQLMVRTEHAYDETKENTYEIPLLEDQTFAHILVLPDTLEVKGEGVEFVSKDDKQGVKLFEWERTPEQNRLLLTISGKAADSLPEVAETSQSQAEAGHSGPQVTNAAHPLDTYRWVIVGIVAGLLLAVALFTQFR